MKASACLFYLINNLHSVNTNMSLEGASSINLPRHIYITCFGFSPDIPGNSSGRHFKGHISSREQGLISVAHKLKPHLLTSPMYGKFTIFTYFSIQLEKGHPFEESAKWSTVGMKLDSCQIVLKILYLLLLCERSTRNSFRQSFQTLSQNEAGHCARNFKLLRLLIWKWGNSFYQALGVQHNLNFLNMHIGSPILSC